MTSDTEQFEALVNDIRVQLSRGNYQMDLDDLPYTGQARNVASSLWASGWRPLAGKEDLESLLAFHSLTSNLRMWIEDLETEHDRKKAEMSHEDDYQNGYLHGMTAAIGYLKEELDQENHYQRWKADND